MRSVIFFSLTRSYTLDNRMQVSRSMHECADVAAKVYTGTRSVEKIGYT